MTAKNFAWRPVEKVSSWQTSFPYYSLSSKDRYSSTGVIRRNGSSYDLYVYDHVGGERLYAKATDVGSAKSAFMEYFRKHFITDGGKHILVEKWWVEQKTSPGNLRGRR